MKTPRLGARVCALLALLSSSIAYTQETPVKLNIPAQPLDTALNAWAGQTGYQVLIAIERNTERHRAPTVTGTYTPEGALKILLANTDLRYQFVARRTVAIRAAQASGSRSTMSEARSGNQNNPEEANNVADTPRTDPHELEAAAANDQGGKQAETNVVQLSEVVVTGTHIQGSAPIGSRLQVFTREDILQSTAGTLGAFARQIPGNFSNVDSLSNSASNISRSSGLKLEPNVYNSTAFNLRGLGPSATLTLLNGHRIAPAGASGSFVDISAIPLSAVEHVDVLADGASAIYGTDAVAGVVNVVTRKNFVGGESRVRYGETTDGGGDTLSASHTIGTSWGSGSLLLAYDYNWSGGLDAAERDYIEDQGGPFSLLPKDRRHSAIAAGSQQIGSRTTLTGNVLYGTGDFTLGGTVAGTAQSVSSFVGGSTTQIGTSLGIDRSLSSDSRLSVVANYSQLRQSSRTDTLTRIPSLNIETSTIGTTAGDSEEFSVDALIDGKFLSVYGNPLNGAIGGSFRSEEFATESASVVAGVARPPVQSSLRRHVSSIFGELVIPLIAESNRMRFAHQFEISAAIRYDHYDDFGSATNPKFGLQWSPVSGFDLRGTYGRSYRAPLLTQIGSPVAYRTQRLPSPGSPTGAITPTLLISGGNPDLRAEKAETFTAGFELRPLTDRSLSFSMDYYNIDYRDRITTLPQDVLNRPFGSALAVHFLNLSPSLPEVQAAFDSPNFLGDNAGLGPSGVRAIFDIRNANMAAMKQSGIEVGGRYRFETSVGRISLSTSLNRIIHYDFKTTATAPQLSLVDSFGQPTKLRGYANAAWNRGGLSTVITLNYVDGYKNTLLDTEPTIDDWATVNLHVSYGIGETSPLSALRDLTVSLDVTNALDEQPPYVEIPNLLPGQNPIPFDPANASPLGRSVAISLNKRW